MPNLIALAQILVFLGLAFTLYRGLLPRVAAGTIGHHLACLIYGLVLFALPSVLTRAFVHAGYFIYETWPALRVAAWDAGLALLLYLAMWLCYALGLVAAVVACRRFLAACK